MKTFLNTDPGYGVQVEMENSKDDRPAEAKGPKMQTLNAKLKKRLKACYGTETFRDGKGQVSVAG